MGCEVEFGNRNERFGWGVGCLACIACLGFVNEIIIDIVCLKFGDNIY